MRYLDALGTVRGLRLTRASVGNATARYGDLDSFRVHVDRADVGLFVGRTRWGMRSGSHVFALSRRLDAADGSLRRVASRVNAIEARKATGRRTAFIALGVTTVLLWGAFVIGVGILARSERYRLALGVALRRSRSAERAKNRLLASLSHELRTPLTAILGFSSPIEQRSHEARVQQMAGTVRKSAQLLILLLTQVLDAALAEARALAVTSAPEPVREIVADACALFVPAAEVQGVRLVGWIADAVPARVDCDGTRLRQVMNNRLSNAVKSTERGSILVTTRFDGEMLRIDVADTGTGIPVEAHARVFERFRQADDRIASTRGGSGLGLGLARAFVRRMGGGLVLDSAEGRGTTVTARLPRTRAGATAHPDATAPAGR